MTIKWFKIIKTTYITIIDFYLQLCIAGLFSILVHGLYGVQFPCLDNKINIKYIFLITKKLIVKCYANESL